MTAHTVRVVTVKGGAAVVNLATSEDTDVDAKIATAVAGLVNSAPALLDTLGELADALGDDANYAATMVTALAGKAALAGAIFTGLVAFSGTTHAGLKLNNLTTAQRDALSSPAAGYLVHNTTTAALSWYSGTGWASWKIADGKLATISNTLTLSGTDGSTLAIGTGGTLGTAAYTAASAYQAAGSYATLAGSEELTNKTLTSSVGKGTWTTSGTWTLPAHTLGGTVTGGGQQINGVIIGTTGPLAGSFTTLSATAALTVNFNATAPPTVASTALYVQGADGAGPLTIFNAFATNSALRFYRANTTAASPSAVASANVLGELRCFGYGATAYVAGAGIRFIAKEAFTDSTSASDIVMLAVPTSSITLSEVFRVSAASNNTPFLTFGTQASTGPALTRTSVAGAPILSLRLGDNSAVSGIIGNLYTGEAAVTGLTPGALAALTSSSLVLRDSAGVAYRVPCLTP